MPGRERCVAGHCLTPAQEAEQVGDDAPAEGEGEAGAGEGEGEPLGPGGEGEGESGGDTAGGEGEGEGEGEEEPLPADSPPTIDGVAVPAAAVVGVAVLVGVTASDAEGPITIRWTATVGAFRDPAAADAERMPARTGAAALTVRVTDGAGQVATSGPHQVVVASRPDCAEADGYGIGAGCLGPDCDDTEAAAYPGAVEVCDGVDNDRDGDPDTGCERHCRPTADADVACDGLDDDCDGVIDGGGACGDEQPDVCAIRASYLGDTLCEDFGAPLEQPERHPVWTPGALQGGGAPMALAVKGGRAVAPVGAAGGSPGTAGTPSGSTTAGSSGTPPT